MAATAPAHGQDLFKQTHREKSQSWDAEQCLREYRGALQDIHDAKDENNARATSLMERETAVQEQTPDTQDLAEAGTGLINRSVSETIGKLTDITGRVGLYMEDHIQDLKRYRHKFPSHVPLPDNTASDPQEQSLISVPAGDWTKLWKPRFINPLSAETKEFLHDRQNKETIYNSFTHLSGRLVWTPEERRAQSEFNWQLRDALVNAKKALVAAKAALDHTSKLLRLDEIIKEQEAAARQAAAPGTAAPGIAAPGGGAQGAA